MELENQITIGPLTEIYEVGDRFICSLLGLAPKENTKWRRIQHLSHLFSRSIRCHIPKK